MGKLHVTLTCRRQIPVCVASKFVSNPTVIELKVKILYVICFAFSFRLQIFHNIKVDLLGVFIFDVFVIYTYRTVQKVHKCVREEDTASERT